MSILLVGHHHTANGYSAKHSEKLRLFADQMHHKKLKKKTRPPIQPLNENDNTWRALAVVNDGLDNISYPIAAIDTCDCVTFPDDEPIVTDCSNDVYWGTFQINFTDEGCYDFSFDESVVYENCPSGTAEPGEVTEYALCDFDFTDDGTGTSPGGVAEEEEEEVEEEEEEESTTSTKSLRQETIGAAKTTHIHLTVHRLATFALEAVLALQSTWT